VVAVSVSAKPHAFSCGPQGAASARAAADHFHRVLRHDAAIAHQFFHAAQEGADQVALGVVGVQRIEREALTCRASVAAAGVASVP
jgi:hypothetical protein